MSELSLKLLRDAGLSPDWMTIYVGWQGLDSYRGYFTRLETTEVKGFAYERVGVGSSEETYVCIRVIDADNVRQGLRSELRYFQQLAENRGVSEEIARRKWRLAALFGLRHHVVRLIDQPMYANSLWFYEMDDALTDFGCFELDWRDLILDPPLLNPLFQGRDQETNVSHHAIAPEDIIHAFRRIDDWMDGERSAILEAEAEGQRNLGGGRVR